MEYPSNSNKAKVSVSKESKNLERVTTNSAVRRKKPFFKSITETFSQADAASVLNFVVMDVIVPAAKDMLSDAISSGLDQLLFGGESRGGRRGGTRQPNNGYVSYNRYSSNNTLRPEPYRGPSISKRGRATHNFDEIILPTRVEAESVIDRLFDVVDRFEIATVSDLYELVGISGNFTDERYGWSNLRGAGVSRVKNGYLLNLPRPEQID